MPGKRITIDELAAMTRKSFDELHRELHLMRGDMVAGFAVLNKNIGEMDTRLSTVERLLTSSRLDRIKDDIRVLKTKSGIS